MSSTENLVKRNLTKEDEDKLLDKIYGNMEDDDDDSDDEIIPSGRRLYIAKRNIKPDSWACIAFQVILVLAVLSLAFYAYYYFEHMHVNVVKAYAHMGFDTAQHELANRYLHGAGVERHIDKAMDWFKKAAEQGHPHASYNLAIGQLKGLHSHINHSEAKRLIQHAAKNDVPEAKQTLENLCNSGGCE